MRGPGEEVIGWLVMAEACCLGFRRVNHDRCRAILIIPEGRKSTDLLDAFNGNSYAVDPALRVWGLNPENLPDLSCELKNLPKPYIATGVADCLIIW